MLPLLTSVSCVRCGSVCMMCSAALVCASDGRAAHTFLLVFATVHHHRTITFADGSMLCTYSVDHGAGGTSIGSVPFACLRLPQHVPSG